MPQIAQLNPDFLLIEVREVPKDQWKTDINKLSVRLPDLHDMREKIGEYYFDFELNSFMPLAAGHDDLDKIVDVLCDLTMQICEKCNIQPSEEATRVINKWFASVR